MKTKNITNLTSFYCYYLRCRKLYLLIFLVIGVFVALEVSITPYLLKLIVDRISAEEVINDSSFNVVELVVIYIFILFILNFLLRVNDFIALSFYPDLKSSVIDDMYVRILKYKVEYFYDNLSGSVSKKILDLAENTELIIKDIVEIFFPLLCSLIISSITLCIVSHWVLSCILLIWSIFYVYGTYKVSSKLERYSRNAAISRVNVSGQLSDSIFNISTIKAFGTRAYETNRLNKTINGLTENEKALYMLNMHIAFFQGMSKTLLISILFCVLLVGHQQNWITAGDFAMIFVLSTSVLSEIYNIGKQTHRLVKMIGVCNQSLTLLKVGEVYQDFYNGKNIKNIKGRIEFRNVEFAYSNGEKIFSNFNLEIKEGEKIGIVGTSGIGKSTLIKLILRLVDVNAGKILIDGESIENYNIDSLLAQISLIPQHSDIFHRSIEENISFVKPNASTQEIIKASKAAYCYDFIKQLCDGYATVLGEKGAKLSGGQKQRIAIARAFLKNAPILLVDEATTGLDPITDRLVQQSIQCLQKHKTTIIISHKMENLKFVDRIVVLGKTKIIEEGTYDALLAKPNGVFRSMCKI